MQVKDTVRRIIKKAMKVDMGDKGLDKTFQKEFEKETKCVHCGGTARLAFVAHEKDNKGNYLCELYKNDPDGTGYWLHDACAVAVYLCKDCLEPTAKLNQA